MKYDLQLDRSRLLGFKLAATSEAAGSREPSDPRIGAKIGKIVGSRKPCDPRIGAKIGKIVGSKVR